MTDELVNVAVPRKYLSNVYRLIAQLDEGKEPSKLPAPSGALLETADEWTPSRIKKMVAQSDKKMLAILKAMANHAGEWLSTAKLASAIGGGADWNSVAGALGAFGRRLRSRYRLETKPYERRSEHGVGKVYRMSKEMAQQILDALNDADAK